LIEPCTGDIGESEDGADSIRMAASGRRDFLYAANQFTTMFTKLVKEVKVSGLAAEVSGLGAGDYFWNVTASDAKKQTSEYSETFKFSLVSQAKSQDMVLEIESTQIHGRVAEIIGRAEPGAALIVNGQAVANIGPDGAFRHFTEPLEPGQHTIVVIGSNRRGGTAKQQVSIVVPK
jgi:hypothetical protein